MRLRMRKWLELLRELQLDYTRIQIFLGFILAMLLVLTLTFGISYAILSKRQNEDAKQYTNEIASQVTGRLGALFNEIDTLTLQLSTDTRVQEILTNQSNAQNASFDERVAMRQILTNTSAYSNAIQDIALFSTSNSIYPVINKSPIERVGLPYITEADEGAGSLVWVGRDPENPSFLLAVRQIRLEKKQYQNGGYLVARINSSLIDFIREDVAGMKGSVIYLLDSEGNDITTEENNKPHLLSSNSKEQNSNYITVKQKIKGTNWTLAILLPKEDVMQGIAFLKTVLVLASILGIVLFALLSYYLSSLITSPIKKLTMTMRKGRDGVLTENVDHYFNHEINELNIVYNQMVGKIHYLIETVYEKELMKSRSEIRALHSQINPHFLFNTLDSLYWSLIRKDEDELANFVIKLADLFRYTIKSSTSDDFVYTYEELEQVKRYVDIMYIRWGDRLHFEIEVDSAVEMNRIPKLIVQPLVENAITHGIEPKDEGGIVKVTVKETDNFTYITVRDNGVGIEEDRVMEIQKRLKEGSSMESISKSTGIGLFNVHRLIQMYFGQEFGLEIQSNKNVGTIVVLRLPARS